MMRCIKSSLFASKVNPSPSLGSRKSAQSSKKEAQEEDDSPFLPPILPKKPKQQPKFVVQSREIATQITADALVPTQVVPDYWISKDTTINRQYDDLALRVSYPFSISFEVSIHL